MLNPCLPLPAGAIALSFACAGVALAEISVTAPDDERVVVGTAIEDPVFSVENTGAGTLIDIASSPGFALIWQDEAVGVPAHGPSPLTEQAFSGGSVESPALGSVIVDAGVLAGAAGDTAAVSVTVTPQGGSGVTATTDYHLVQNRALTGGLTVDAGRHMASQAIGHLTLHGGALDDDHASRITVHSDGVASVEGLTLTSDTDFTFNGAGQSHDLVVKHHAGSYDIDLVLPATHRYTPNGHPTVADFGGWTGSLSQPRNNALISAERIQGADLDLSGVSIDVSGTALLDRELTAAAPVVLRTMQADPTATHDIDETVTIVTSGDDDTHTRLRVGAFDQTSAGLRAQLGADHDFDGYGDTATVALTGTIALDKSSIGKKTHAVEVGGHIATLENGGAGLAGQNVQSSLPVGVTYHVLANNEVTGSDVVVRSFTTNIDGVEFVNPSLRMAHSTDTHTDITINNRFSTTSKGGTVTLTEAGGQIVGEGLAHEDVQDSFSFNVGFELVQHASISGTPHGVLEDGDTFALANAAGASRATADIFIRLGGEAAHLFGVGPLALRPTGGMDDPMSERVTLAPGVSMSPWDVAFFGGRVPPSAGEFGAVYRAELTAEISEYYYDGSGLTAREAGELGGDGVYGARLDQLRTWTLEHVIEATGDSATTDLGPGTDLGEGGLTLTSTKTRSTTASLIDSGVLDEAREVSVSFAAITEATATQSGADGFDDLNSDIVELTGLDNILHVVQVSYDPTAGEGNPFLAWFFEDTDGDETDTSAWVNAVLGNHNIETLDLVAGTLTLVGEDEAVEIEQYLAAHRHATSYGAYLLANGGNPELGDFGYDAARQVVWAVIDHNSTFGSVVPEPTAVLLLAGGAPLLLRRRR